MIGLPGALPQVRHGESVLWRTGKECCALGAKHIPSRRCPCKSLVQALEVSGNFLTERLAMLESAVGAVGYVIRKLNQVRENGDASQSRFEAIEIIEAVILALVAVATAWSGYQAAQWAGKRAEQYAEATRFRVTAEGLATLTGQERIYDSDTFNSWLAAKLDGKSQTAEFFERRFRDE